jgi:hypothetical protein
MSTHTDKIREALEWYADNGEAMDRYNGTQAALAVIATTAMDGGIKARRALAALSELEAQPPRTDAMLAFVDDEVAASDIRSRYSDELINMETSTQITPTIAWELGYDAAVIEMRKKALELAAQPSEPRLTVEQVMEIVLEEADASPGGPFDLSIRDRLTKAAQ